MTETAHTPLPCPLCHAEAPQVYESRYHTHCNKCGTVAPTRSWNTRADSHHRLVEARNALRAFHDGMLSRSETIAKIDAALKEAGR